MIESMQTSPVARVIISISAMLFAGFAMTRITKRLRLPNVTGYILAGILMGPCCFNLIPQEIISGTDFLSDIALAFIAFSAGEFFKVDVLRRNGAKVIIITVLEACLSSLAVFVLVYGVLHLELSFAIVLSALASATAPASTMMTIRQTGAHGDFVDTLLQVVALDDVVGLILYSMAISVAIASETGSLQLSTVMMPIFANLCVLILGAVFGWILKLFFRKRSTDNRLIVSIAMLFAFCGICAMADVSPLLGCMSMGMTYINLTGDEKLFRQLGYWSPPILLLFFVRSGLNFNLGALTDTLGAGGSVPLHWSAFCILSDASSANTPAPISAVCLQARAKRFATTSVLRSSLRRALPSVWLPWARARSAAKPAKCCKPSSWLPACFMSWSVPPAPSSRCISPVRMAKTRLNLPLLSPTRRRRAVWKR